LLSVLVAGLPKLLRISASCNLSSSISYDTQP